MYCKRAQLCEAYVRCCQGGTAKLAGAWYCMMGISVTVTMISSATCTPGKQMHYALCLDVCVSQQLLVCLG